ncbi:universal stress protein [Flavivirga rizhaonensis]|uniref:Universal stress protein n=1 Tax=Flavivirga rizhaonensis TaxID=2559571 RepID=A0A4S1E441_9FLAO|nr:universal stress protein [Flavivirga rizhaonensis]TGV04848.1 universal stress protein [Flavivirga rizhaonensis]
MNKILVPVDFSDTSLNALSYAIKLFGSSSVEITILHIYGIKSTALLMKSIDGLLEKDAQRSMDELIEKVQKEFPKIAMKTKIVLNDTVTAITSLGNSGKYDYIVMGTKGASGLKEVFIGSIAGGVISKTKKAPVIVVPRFYYYNSLDEIVFAISDNPLSNTTVIEPLRKIAKMHKSKIKVLHITEKQTSDIQETLNQLKDLNPSVTYAFGTGNTNADLNDYLKKNDSKLLCLIRGKKDFFDRLFGESVTLKQTFSSPVPLLILHD